jgi:hypothetical protein
MLYNKMFYVLSTGIYTHLSTPIPIFINRIRHFWIITNVVCSVCYAFPELVFCIYFNFQHQILSAAPKIKIQNGSIEDRERHPIGTSQNQPHINADVAPQKYNGTEGLLQENARRIVAFPLLHYHVLRHRVNANRRILVLWTS